MALQMGIGAVGIDGLEILTTGVSDLALVKTTAGYRVVTTTGSQGGLLARDATSLAATDSRAFAPQPPTLRPAEAHVAEVSLGGRAALIAYGAGTGAEVMWLDRAGNPLAGAEKLAFGGQVITSIAVTATTGGDVIFTTSMQSAGITAWSRAANGTLTRMASLPLPSTGAEGAAAGGAGVADLIVLKHGATTWLAAASALDHKVLLWKVAANGAVTFDRELGPADGLGISSPAHLASVSVAGHDFLLIGSTGSSSISVVEIGANGQMIPRDQVNDDLGTRFQRVTALDAITVQGRSFVAASGADGGVTVMELLRDGRLVHLATFADTDATTLASPTGLALSAAAGGLDLFVSSMTEAGVTRLHVDLGGLGGVQTAGAAGATLSGGQGSDLLIGGQGRNVLSGGAGADVIVGGTGNNRLTGGAGADTFVLRPGAAANVVTDFEPGIDRLDLSAFGRIYSTDALAFTILANGLEIRIGNDVIRLESRDGSYISPDDLALDDLVGLWHVPLTPPTVLDQHSSGGAGPDLLQGGAGDDYLIGGAGADTLLGGAGNDTLLGGSTDALFDTPAGTIYRLYQAALGRTPDWQGHLTWTLRHEAGMSLAQVADGFLRSKEFRERFDGATDTGDFVTLLYEHVLHRAPDAQGFANWTTQIDSGAMSRAQVVLGFVQSKEFIADTEAAALAFSREGHQAHFSGDVYRIYQAVLGRDPDLNGFLDWTSRLTEGTTLLDVADGFTRSAEFRTRFSGAANNKGFVTLLYNNVLERAPDEAGLARWTNALESGRLTRAEAVLGFSQSPEFTNATSDALTAFMRRFGEGDVLDGGAGNDVLFGGIGADTFVFSPADRGSDQVAGLEPWDWIDLSAFHYASAAEALAKFSRSGADVWFHDQGVNVLFHDTHLATISADMLLL